MRSLYHNLMLFLLVHGVYVSPAALSIPEALRITRRRRARTDAVIEWEDWHDLGGEA